MYKGYLIINLKDYALLEFYYQTSSPAASKKLSNGIMQKDISASKLVKWVKDNLSEKYYLLYYQVGGKLTVTDLNHVTDVYEVNYEIQNLGIWKDTKSGKRKGKKVSSKLTTLNWSPYHTKDEIWNRTDLLLKSEQQYELIRNSKKER